MVRHLKRVHFNDSNIEEDQIIDQNEIDELDEICRRYDILACHEHKHVLKDRKGVNMCDESKKICCISEECNLTDNSQKVIRLDVKLGRDRKKKLKEKVIVPFKYKTTLVVAIKKLEDLSYDEIADRLAERLSTVEDFPKGFIGGRIKEAMTVALDRIYEAVQL